MTTANETRYDGAPLLRLGGRTNFLNEAPLDRRRRNVICQSAFLSGIAPALVAAAAIILFSGVRYTVSVAGRQIAVNELTHVKTISHYPLSTRDAVQNRSVLVKRAADAVDANANGVGPTLAQLVNIANAMPPTIRVKTITLNHQGATVTDGEALNYQSLVRFQTQMDALFPTTIASATLGANPNGGIRADQRGGVWKWAGTVLTTKPTSTHP